MRLERWIICWSMPRPTPQHDLAHKPVHRHTHLTSPSYATGLHATRVTCRIACFSWSGARKFFFFHTHRVFVLLSWKVPSGIVRLHWNSSVPDPNNMIYVRIAVILNLPCIAYSYSLRFLETEHSRSFHFQHLQLLFVSLFGDRHFSRHFRLVHFLTRRGEPCLQRNKYHTHDIGGRESPRVQTVRPWQSNTN